jgi:hypothetical protein
MFEKGPTMAKDSRPEFNAKRSDAKRTHDGADIGGSKAHRSGYGHVGDDISSRVEKWSKNNGRSGRC